jgi:L-fuculose-phosphate aldolase
MPSKTLPFSATAIGVVHSRLKDKAAAPRIHSESTEVGTLEISPDYREGLKGLKAGQRILVLFWLHEARRDMLQVYPRGDRSRGLQGVFATRSPMRPNPIAVSELTVLAVRGSELEVAGLDVIDGTPILDIKRSLATDRDPLE